MELLAILVGLVLRLGLPVGALALLAWWLKRLDQRWQREAEVKLLAERVPATPCWQVRGCVEEKRAGCPAYLHPESACWQHWRSADGTLRSACLECQVFCGPTVPQTAQSPLAVGR